MTTYYERNKERMKQKARENYYKRREIVLSKRREDYSQDPGKYIARTTKYYRDHWEEKQEYYKEYRRKNREKLNAYQRERNRRIKNGII